MMIAKDAARAEVERLRRLVEQMRTALLVFADAKNWGDTPRGGQVFVDGEQTLGKKLACQAIGHPPRKPGAYGYCLCGDEYCSPSKLVDTAPGLRAAPPEPTP